jgi:hypothetical protein
MPILSDSEIQVLILETKTIPAGLSWPLTMSENNGHRRKDFQVDSDSGHRFVIKTRQSCVNPMDFSVILGYMLPGSYTVFRLRRYNGRSHDHTNVIENETFYDFHIHTATERYQQKPGFKEDHFAEQTNQFCDLQSAIDCLINECGFSSASAGTPPFPE